MKKLLVLLCILSLNYANGATTHIVDTIRYSDRSLASGKVIITNQAFTSSAGNHVTAATKTVTVSNGYFSVYLEPNDAAIPAGTSYRVQYQMNNPARGLSGLTSTEYWIVTTSVTNLRISQVRVYTVPTPSLVLQPSQINTAGAITGQLLKFDGNTIVWGGASGVFYFVKSGGGTLGDSVRFSDSRGLTGTLSGNEFYYTLDSATWLSVTDAIRRLGTKSDTAHTHTRFNSLSVGDFTLTAVNDGELLVESSGKVQGLSGSEGDFIQYSGGTWRAGTPVTSLNNQTGAVTLVGAGGATISADDGVITITAGGGGGGGSVTGVQNTDGMITVTDPAGPTVTLGITANSIDSTKIKTGNVTTTDILDGTINTIDFAATAKPPLSTLADSSKKVDTTSFPIATDAELALKVASTRNVSTGYGLSGGGNLTADRTLTADTASATGLASKARLAGTVAGKSDVGHTHSTTDINAGTLPITRGGTGITTIGASGTVPQSNGTAYVATLPVFKSSGTVPAGTAPRVAFYSAGVTASMQPWYSMASSIIPIGMVWMETKTDSIIFHTDGVEPSALSVNVFAK
jgi:hypothetical protein